MYAIRFTLSLGENHVKIKTTFSDKSKYIAPIHINNKCGHNIMRSIFLLKCS